MTPLYARHCALLLGSSASLLHHLQQEGTRIYAAIAGIWGGFLPSPQEHRRERGLAPVAPKTVVAHSAYPTDKVLTNKYQRAKIIRRGEAAILLQRSLAYVQPKTTLQFCRFAQLAKTQQARTLRRLKRGSEKARLWQQNETGLLQHCDDFHVSRLAAGGARAQSLTGLRAV